MPGIETIKTYLLSAAFLLPDAQDTCSNVTSKCSRQTMSGYLHSSHVAPWGRLRGAWVRLWVRDGVRAHMFSPSTTNLQRDIPHSMHGTLPRLQPEKMLVVYSLKPNQPPHQWMEAKTCSSPFCMKPWHLAPSWEKGPQSKLRKGKESWSMLNQAPYHL